MQNDFFGGGRRKLTPVNDLSKPKVPHFDSLPTEQSDQLPEPASFQNPIITPAEDTPVPAPPNTPKHHSQFMSFKWQRDKRTTLITLLTTIVLITLATAFAFISQPPKSQGGTEARKNPVHTPKVIPIVSNLTGLPADAAINQRPITGVMIENSRDARPQSGLDQAGVVFEAIAEGGITRFMALFQDNTPDYIGPIRSARPYYVQWCMGFDCALAHVGGSPEALANIREWGTKDLDQPFPGAYRRISSRYSPHNMYGSVPKFNELEASKGYGAATFTSLGRKADAPNNTPNASNITINISSALYNSSYSYDKTTNSYLRNQGGAPHTVVDGNGTETQLKPKTIVAMVMNYSVLPDKHSVYGTIGSGQAFIFQDGTMTPATWNKPDIKTNVSLTDSRGKVVPLNAGQTWFVAVSDTNKVIFN